MEQLPPDVNAKLGQAFTLRRKIFSILHTYFHFLDSSGEPVLECKMKGFKLKEQLVISCSNTKAELIGIKARSVIDFGATYDVVDLQSGANLGSLRRHGFSSMARDKWSIMCPNGQLVGSIEEDSLALALLRRLIGMVISLNVIPQKYNLAMHGVQAALLKQNFNPFVQKLAVHKFPQANLDTRLLIASTLLMAGIEGRQS